MLTVHSSGILGTDTALRNYYTLLKMYMTFLLISVLYI